MPRKKTTEDTVLLPIRVDLGKGNVFNAGQPVPITKDFTKEDADKIIAFHGPFKGAATVDDDGSHDAEVEALKTANEKLNKHAADLKSDLTDAEKALADVTSAWQAVEQSMTAEDGTDEANALEANVAALNALTAAE